LAARTKQERNKQDEVRAGNNNNNTINSPTMATLSGGAPTMTTPSIIAKETNRKRSGGSPTKHALNIATANTPSTSGNKSTGTPISAGKNTKTLGRNRKGVTAGGGPGGGNKHGPPKKSKKILCSCRKPYDETK